MSILNTIGRWLGFGGALRDSKGSQSGLPGSSLVPSASLIGPDQAMQISTVWACVSLRANTVATLPFFAYYTRNGMKELARNSSLYQLLHESPNSRMTPRDFWVAMMLNHDLRGNAYARLERREDGTVFAMWPMAADQVEPIVLDDGSMVYKYTIAGESMVLSDQSVLHLRDLGNGTVGLDKLVHMRATTDEAAKAITQAASTFATGGKPTGVLMVDRLLTSDQREALRQNFADLQIGDNSRLAVLEANMKYQQLSLAPEQMELLETRKFGVEEVCRWYNTPPVLVHHSNVTAWGSGIEQIVDGFYKLAIRSILVSIEQAVRKQVMTPAQRARMSVEFNFDALLRGNIQQRYTSYATAVQNGIMTRNEARQYENLPPDPNGDDLTVQVNLTTLSKLGQTVAQGNINAPDQDPPAA